MKSVVVPLILQFLIGAMITVVFNASEISSSMFMFQLQVADCSQMCGTLLVDLHPKSPASAQAALNIVRCSFSAGGLALLQIVIDGVGVGWCFTIFAGLSFSMLVPTWAVHRYGSVWRNAKVAPRRHDTATESSTNGSL